MGRHPSYSLVRTIINRGRRAPGGTKGTAKRPAPLLYEEGFEALRSGRMSPSLPATPLRSRCGATSAPACVAHFLSPTSNDTIVCKTI